MGSLVARRILTLEESDLVPLAIAGNDAAFTRLYRRHVSYVAQGLYRVVGRDLDFDHIISATFVEARRDLVRLREPEHLRGWLMEIALRQLVEHIQKADPQRELADLMWIANPVVWGAAASVVGHLRLAIADMPKKIRVPFVLQRLGEVPTEAIARICKCTVREVRRRVWSAERLLRKKNLAVIVDRVRVDADVPWHDLREMRVLRTIRAVPVVRVGFAALHEAPAAPPDTVRERVLRYGALTACSAVVVGFGAWIGPIIQSVLG